MIWFGKSFIKICKSVIKFNKARQFTDMQLCQRQSQVDWKSLTLRLSQVDWKSLTLRLALEALAGSACL